MGLELSLEDAGRLAGIICSGLRALSEPDKVGRVVLVHGSPKELVDNAEALLSIAERIDSEFRYSVEFMDARFYDPLKGKRGYYYVELDKLIGHELKPIMVPVVPGVPHDDE